MFGKLIQNWKTSRVLNSIQKEPIYITAEYLLRKYLFEQSEGLAKYASQNIKEKIMADTLKEISEIVLAENQILANRKKLATYVLAMAKYQVLIMPEKNEEDLTGLRGKPGITGELKSHIKEIAEKDKEIKEIALGMDSPTETGIYEECLSLYWMYHVKASVFNVIRGHFNDNHPNSEKDWFLPFVEAMSAWEEYKFRQLIDLPCELEDGGIGILYAVKYSTFLNFVVNGATYPNFEWEEACKDSSLDEEI